MRKSITSHLKRLDWILLVLATLITVLGLVVLYSLSLSWENWVYFRNQTIFLLIGIVIVLCLSFLDIEALKESSAFVFVLYSFCVLLLAGLFFFASEIRGTRSWYSFGSFRFEPVEITKIIFILFFAKYFSQRYVEMYQARHIFLSAIYAFIPSLLVFFQPDFGSAMILVILWFGILLTSGIKQKHILMIMVIGLFSLFLIWNLFLTEEQKTRFSTFLEPYINPEGEYLDPQGTGYHIRQSIIAVGSGGIFGKGPFQPLTQAKLGFLPEAHTDFIFATFAEMFGIFGIFVLFLLFVLFFFRLLTIAKNCKNNFSRLLISGFMILVGAEVFINIAMNIGILPITGLPLPFLSYGGSSLLSLFIGIGIIESIKSHISS
ncbi:rod shape-determining protein RodA [bacterium]|nr:rod shape-determining protein RodA [bacterium]